MAAQNGVPSDSISITGLPPGTTDEQLLTAFSAYGEIVHHQLLPQGGLQERAALLRFRSVEDAAKVAQGLDGHVPEGNSTPIRVSFAGEGKGPTPARSGLEALAQAAIAGAGSGVEALAAAGGLEALAAAAAAGGGLAGGCLAGGYGKSGGAGLERGGPYGKGTHPKSSPVPTDNLYICGMPPDIDQSHVHQFFGQYGRVVQTKIVRPGQGKGAALVRFATVEEAMVVKQTLQHTTPEGMPEPLQVDYAGAPAHSGGSTGVPGGPSDPQASTNLYVTGMPSEIDQAAVRDFFGQYGTVTRCKIVRPGQGPGAALVEFASVEEAAKIKDQLSGNILPGMSQPLNVNFADPTKSQRFREEKEQRQQALAQTWQANPSALASLSSSLGNPADFGAFGGLAASPDNDLLKAAAAALSPEVSMPVSMPISMPVSMLGPAKGGGKGCFSMKMVVKGFETAGGLPGGGEGAGFNEAASLFVRGLPLDCQDIDLYRLFGSFGSIAPKGVHVVTWDDGSCRGFGFVNYFDPKVAESAIVILNGTVLPDGSLLSVQYKNAARKV